MSLHRKGYKRRILLLLCAEDSASWPLHRSFASLRIRKAALADCPKILAEMFVFCMPAGSPRLSRQHKAMQ